MNDLTARLHKLATLLEEKGAELEGKRWSASVAAFNRALTRFEEAAEDATRSLAPGLRDLSRLLESPEKKLLDEEVMKKLFKEVLDMRASKDLPASRLRKKSHPRMLTSCVWNCTAWAPWMTTSVNMNWHVVSATSQI